MTRLTLVSNSNRSIQTVVILTNPTHQSISALAKAKLRLKSPATGFRLFNQHGNQLDLKSSLQDGETIYVSCGEDFVGVKTSSSEHVGSATSRVTVISQKTPIDETAITQLHATAKLEGIIMCCGMPDLHPGSLGSPVGAVFHLPVLGSTDDIGCGMSLFQTSLTATLSPSVISRKLYGIEGPYAPSLDSTTSNLAPDWDQATVGCELSATRKEWLAHYGLESTEFDDGSGTIGGGNDFAEVQKVVEVRDQEVFETLGLEKDRLLLLVHSGSRGLGQHILHSTTAPFLLSSTTEFTNYLASHNTALIWARANRTLIAHRVLSALSATGKKVVDIFHNSVEKGPMNFALGGGSASQTGEEGAEEKEVWIHRKGAAPSDQGVIVIPGSRGTRSYLVLPVGDQSKNVYSVAHGAGRLVPREKALRKGKKKYGHEQNVRSPEDLRTTELGSQVICEDVDLLYQEAPSAYKDVNLVVEDLVELGIVKVVAVLVCPPPTQQRFEPPRLTLGDQQEPVVTYKTRSNS